MSAWMGVEGQGRAVGAKPLGMLCCLVGAHPGAVWGGWGSPPRSLKDSRVGGCAWAQLCAQNLNSQSRGSHGTALKTSNKIRLVRPLHCLCPVPHTCPQWPPGGGSAGMTGSGDYHGLQPRVGSVLASDPLDTRRRVGLLLKGGGGRRAGRGEARREEAEVTGREGRRGRSRRWK